MNMYKSGINRYSTCCQLQIQWILKQNFERKSLLQTDTMFYVRSSVYLPRLDLFVGVELIEHVT